MIAGVIFDLGSTLIHFEGDWTSVFEESLHALTAQLAVDGLTIDLEAFRSAFRLEVESSQRTRQQDHLERTSESVLRQTLEGMGIRLSGGIADRSGVGGDVRRERGALGADARAASHARRTAAPGATGWG